jgi:hypothetical protein
MLKLDGLYAMMALKMLQKRISVDKHSLSVMKLSTNSEKFLQKHFI